MIRATVLWCVELSVRWRGHSCRKPHWRLPHHTSADHLVWGHKQALAKSQPPNHTKLLLWGVLGNIQLASLRERVHSGFLRPKIDPVTQKTNISTYFVFLKVWVRGKEEAPELTSRWLGWLVAKRLKHLCVLWRIKVEKYFVVASPTL